MRISRSGFVQNLEGKQVSVESLQQDRGISSSVKNRLSQADLNRDGFIAGAEETSRLFTQLDHYDRDGNRNTIHTNGETQRIHDAVSRATTTPRTAPNSAAARYEELLANNPQLETNQDMINLLMRRNHNNYGAASAEAERYGLDMGDLVSNRDGALPRPNTTGNTGNTTRRRFNSSGIHGLDQVRGFENTSPMFREKTIEVAERLRMDPQHLMAVMSFETGGSFSSSERNRASGATGLIQFMPATARSLGTSTQALSRMSPERQLDYVEKYLKPYAGKMNTLEDAYMAVLWPAAVGRGPNHRLFRSPSLQYRQNRGLDLNRDGSITAREAANKVRAHIS